ncbi:hypothetical protein CVD28_00050 [Bacillus sp. M6-12]|uniref:hypothetical protein n=1 Tax=Bacillus sp. M6-12 TaxID=2054166 RepID=UPI000C75EEB6|nr:hypothetical protein [Bacillus sp. M6-12]PLS18828.1 hypothetical protein CVD28_00050 [Bacillus sp. M6-12]
MVQCQTIENKTIAGIELTTLVEAIQKSEQEGFFLLFQSKVTKESYGVLKPFSSEGKKGYCFVPVLINGHTVTL